MSLLLNQVCYFGTHISGITGISIASSLSLLTYRPDTTNNSRCVDYFSLRLLDIQQNYNISFSVPQISCVSSGSNGNHASHRYGTGNRTDENNGTLRAQCEARLRRVSCSENTDGLINQTYRGHDDGTVWIGSCVLSLSCVQNSPVISDSESQRTSLIAENRRYSVKLTRVRP